MSVASTDGQDHLVSQPQPWNEVWIAALFRPSVSTYQDFVSRPKVSTRRAFTWIFVASWISYNLVFIGEAVQGLFIGEIRTYLLFSLLCATPIMSLFSIIGFVLNVGLCQWLGSALGGSGTSPKLAYAFAAYIAPLFIVTSLLGTVPAFSFLLFPFYAYGVFLNILAVKAVHDFGWGRALASSVVFLALILALVSVGIIIILALLGPAIGDVFSNIITDL